MPIPKPRQGESTDDFMGRCMGNDTMLAEYPDQSQRAAVCMTQVKTEMTDEFEGLVEDDYGLILVQSLDHLVTASNILGRTKYYKQFPPDYLLDIQKRKEAHDAWKSKTYGQIQSEETLFTDDEEEIRLQ